MIIKVEGGLGNQLFFYAYGLYQRQKGYKVRYNLQWYEQKIEGRDYLLDSLYSGIKTTKKTPPVGWKYYQEYRYADSVKKQMMLPHDDIDAVAVHVRRGDTLEVSYPFNLSADYYRNILKMYPDKEVYIFSDDIPWCKEHLPDYKYIDKGVLESFHLMRSCRIKVIANSTYSWWAAFLSNHTEVIAPDMWFKKERKRKHRHYEKNIIHPTWKKMPSC